MRDIWKLKQYPPKWLLFLFRFQELFSHTGLELVNIIVIMRCGIKVYLRFFIRLLAFTNSLQIFFPLGKQYNNNFTSSFFFSSRSKKNSLDLFSNSYYA